MRRPTTRNLGEAVTAFVLAVLVTGYGWLILLNGGVSVAGGVRGVLHTAYVAGDGASVYTGVVFLVAAVFSFVAARKISTKEAVGWGVALVVLLHPLLYVAAAG